MNNGLWLLRPDGRHVRLATAQVDSLLLRTVWARDGADLVSTRREVGGENDRVMRLKSGTNDPGVPLSNARGIVSDWSLDGRWLLTEQDTNASPDILVYDVLHDSSTAWLATTANESSGRFSPDGQWVAYTSDGSGSANVYLRRFDGKGEPIRVSTSGGEYPAWRRDGRELFFVSPGNDLMTASVGRSGETITVGAPQKLFSRALSRLPTVMPYDAAPDGQRFLLNVPDRPPSLFFLQGLDAIMGPN